MNNICFDVIDGGGCGCPCGGDCDNCGGCGCGGGN